VGVRMENIIQTEVNVCQQETKQALVANT